MHSLVIDKSRYASFTHKGAAGELDNTVNYVYSSWLLGSGERHSGGPDLEVYGRDYDPRFEDSKIQYAIPLRESEL
ncbi:MAG: transcriptional regulator protein [Osedax symbiont Rs2]|nr:MAG: transcriptional regulator protein [Osedax symbiont Rs2]